MGAWVKNGVMVYTVQGVENNGVMVYWYVWGNLRISIERRFVLQKTDSSRMEDGIEGYWGYHDPLFGVFSCCKHHYRRVIVL